MQTTSQGYRPTEAKYKGRASETYVTYDIEQKTSNGSTAIYPKVKRVYVAGKIKGWKKGIFKKRTGREVYGVMIEYEQSRGHYQRKEYTAHRGRTSYKVPPTSIKSSSQTFRQVVDVPEKARNIQFYESEKQMPVQYQHALQRVR